MSKDIRDKNTKECQDGNIEVPCEGMRRYLEVQSNFRNLSKFMISIGIKENLRLSHTLMISKLLFGLKRVLGRAASMLSEMGYCRIISITVIRKLSKIVLVRI